MRIRNLLAVLVATGALAFTGGASAHDMSKSQVRHLQQSLNDSGYNVAVDGVWGPNTQRALRDYQHSHGLRVTGRADNATMASLGTPNRMSGSSGAYRTDDPAMSGGSSGISHMGSGAKGSRTQTDTLDNPSTITPSR